MRTICGAGAFPSVGGDGWDGFLELWEERKFAVIHVSHSLQDVAYLSDRVIVFSEKPKTVSASVPIVVPRPRNRAGASIAVSEYVESLRNIICPQ